MELTEQDKRILKYFFLYIQSMGYDEGCLNISMYEDGEIYTNGFFPDEGGEIDLPTEFNTFLDKLISAYEPITFFEDIYDFSYGEVNICLNAVEKTIYFTAKYKYYDTDCYDISKSIYGEFADEKEQRMLEQFFDDKVKEGYEFGEINFDGGGDSGYIQDELILNGEISEDSAPDKVLDVCYDFLNSNFGGWEINEGSQGNFVLDFKNKEIRLNICLNVEQMGDVDGYSLPKNIKL